jgi:hypothetical protein
MTRGIKQEDRLKKKEEIINFISKHQPCKYNFLLKDGHFRRNTLRQYVEELEKENRIVKLDNLYFVAPLNKEQLKEYYNRKNIISTLQDAKISSQLVTRLLRIIINRYEKEPIRTKLAIEKIQDNSDIVSIMESDFLDFVINGHHDQLKIIESMTIKEQLSYFSKSLKYVNPHNIYKILDEFDIHFKAYPRFEYPRFKHLLHDKEYNPDGINPKFQKDNKSPDVGRLEEVYSNRLLAKSLKIIDENGNHVYLYIGDTIAYQAALYNQLKHNKISEDDFKRMYTVILHDHPPKILRKIPENSSIEKILGLELPKEISINYFKELLKNPKFSHYFSCMLFLEISNKITARVNHDNIDKIKRIKQATKKNQRS